MGNKEQFYKYAESLGIKINDAQRLMMLAKAVDENKELPKICKCGNFEYKPNSCVEDGYCRNCREEVASPKTTDTIPTEIPPFLYLNYNNSIAIGYHGDTVVEDEWYKWKKEFLDYYLRKQAEVIAEKAECYIYEEDGEVISEVRKQSILTVSENFIKNIK